MESETGCQPVPRTCLTGWQPVSLSPTLALIFGVKPAESITFSPSMGFVIRNDSIADFRFNTTMAALTPAWTGSNPFLAKQVCIASLALTGQALEPVVLRFAT